MSWQAFPQIIVKFHPELGLNAGASIIYKYTSSQYKQQATCATSSVSTSLHVSFAYPLSDGRKERWDKSAQKKNQL